MAYTDTWDATFEAAPQDSDDVADGADEIRDLKLAIRERLQHDHYMAIAGTDADHGEHKQITFNAPISTPTNAANKAFLYSKDYNSKTELHFEDEDGNETRLTKAGRIDLAEIWDLDADTGYQVEESADEDTHRWDVAGTEMMTLDDGTNGLSVDKISEKTAANGVTIDGLSIKDSKLNTDDSVIAANLADDIIQPDKTSHGFVPVVHVPYNSVTAATQGDSWATKWSVRVKLPSGPTAINGSACIKNSDGSETTSCRISMGGESSGLADRSNDSYGWTSFASTLDVSGLSPGTEYTLEIELKSSSGGTAYIGGISIWWE